MGIRLFQENGSFSTYLLRTRFYFNFIKKKMSVLKMSKYLVFFIRTSDEYLRRYGKGSVVKTDPYKYVYR